MIDMNSKDIFVRDVITGQIGRLVEVDNDFNQEHPMGTVITRVPITQLTEVGMQSENIQEIDVEPGD